MAKPKEPRIRPLHDLVLVRRLPIETKSPGGIIIPDTAQSKADRAEVVAVGPGAWGAHGGRIEPCVKVGDIVLLPQYAGTERGSTDVLIREGDLLGVEEA